MTVAFSVLLNSFEYSSFLVLVLLMGCVGKINPRMP